MRTRRIATAVCAAGAACAVAGCGEFQNTITPQPRTTTHITLLLSGQPNGLMAGLYDAMALGYYKQADMHVYISEPKQGEQPLMLLHNKKTEVAVSSEPNLLLTREQNIPVVAVGTIVQTPLSSVQVKLPVTYKTTVCTRTGKRKDCKTTISTGKPAAKGSSKSGAKGTSSSKSGSNGTTTTTTTTRSGAKVTTTITQVKPVRFPSLGTIGTSGPAANSDLTLSGRATTALAGKNVPNYQGLLFAVRPATIVNDAPDIRRFLQTTARGYEAARQDPEQAIDNLIRLVPSLAPERATLLAQLKAYLPHMFPGVSTMGSSKGHHEPWGFMDQAAWTQFGNWLHSQGLINDPAAVQDSNTNELLAGKGV